MPAKWFREQPTNRNYLAPVGFQLKLDLFEGVDFFCQKANLPGINMPTTEVATRFRSYAIPPGGGVTYDDLSLTFIVDEDLVNYKSVHNWIEEYGNANDTQEGETLFSNGQLNILTSNFNLNHIIDYERLFPISLSPIEFDAGVSDIEFFTAQVTFKYFKYTIRDKNFKV